MSLHERLGIGLIVAGGVVLLAQRAITALREAQARRPRTPHGNPPPKVVHAVLGPKSTQYRRVIICGDVHGCPEELQALLDKVAFRRGVDLLLSVGDLVNKGPDSEKVLQMAKELGMLAVRGNHDDAAYEAFRAWLAGRGLPKPAKHHWVPGLDEGLAALLADLPFTLQLPAYGVIIVHAGLVPGLRLEQQRWLDLTKMRDVVPAAEEKVADVAAADLAAGADVNSLPVGTFDWEEATKQLAALAAAQAAAGASQRAGGSGSSSSGQAQGSSSSGAGDGSGDVAGSGSSGSVLATAPNERGRVLPSHLQLLGREEPNPLGRAWAAVWPGPQHVFFGHDAKRRLQQHPAATGLDTGLVYGGKLTAAVLPPLDESGQPLLQRLNLPPDAEQIQLCTGLPAFLVQVPAKEVHSDKQHKPGEQLKAQRQELAKQHTREALAQQAAQHAQQGLRPGTEEEVKAAAAAAGPAPKSQSSDEKKQQ